jgi:transcription elongation factor GreA
MSNISYYTKEGLKKLRDELNQLKDVERPKASQAIAEARDKGDLSENAEYDAAKEAQGLLEMKISKMEETLSNARLIDESQLDTSKVLVLSTVKLKNKDNGAEIKYTLVAESEANLKSGKISVSSPIGKGLLGKKVGDTAEITVPNGTLKFDILEITRSYSKSGFFVLTNPLTSFNLKPFSHAICFYQNHQRRNSLLQNRGRRRFFRFFGHQSQCRGAYAVHTKKGGR